MSESSEPKVLSTDDYALVRVCLDASRQRWPVSLEVSSDGGKTWKFVPTGGCTITNNASGRPEISWKHTILPPNEDGTGNPQPLSTLLYSNQQDNIMGKGANKYRTTDGQ